MFVYNIHTPSRSFALPHKKGENYAQLVQRIAQKAGMTQEETTLLKSKSKSAPTSKNKGVALEYEHEHSRWALEDDDDLDILLDRFPPESSQSVTFHLSLPPTGTAPPAPGRDQDEKDYRSHTFPPAQHAAEFAKSQNGEGKPGGYARSVRSTKSWKTARTSGQEVEPMGVTHKREWEEFHQNNGVRTVMGKVGKVDNVRMLLKSGYKGVYVSRTFALKSGLIPAKSSLGTSGYVGLVSIGKLPITVGGRTAEHQVKLSEESHFDVVLGRDWVEKMGVKTDPLDQTVLTYMDSGEAIPCDLVVLKDAKGDVITIT